MFCTTMPDSKVFRVVHMWCIKTGLHNFCEHGCAKGAEFSKRQKAGTLKSKQSSDRIQKSNTEESNEKTEKSRRLVQNL